MEYLNNFIRGLDDDTPTPSNANEDLNTPEELQEDETPQDINTPQQDINTPQQESQGGDNPQDPNIPQQDINTPLKESQGGDTPQKESQGGDTPLPYKKALRKYLKLKTTYNKSGKKKKKCVGCKRSVGTIFSYKDGAYTAICGNINEPCPLNIQIIREVYGSKKEQLKELKTEESKLKYDIIDLKLRFLFRMMTETDMVDEFSKLKEDFNKIFTEIQSMEKEILRENEGKREDREIQKEAELSLKTTIQEIKSSIREFQETQDIQHIQDAVIMYTDEIKPTLKTIRQLKNIKYRMQSSFFSDEIDEIYFMQMSRKGPHYDPDEYIKVPGRVVAFQKR